MPPVELGWRQFTFFEKHDVLDPQDPSKRFVGLKNLDACCAAAGNGFVLFGEQCGNVFKLTKTLDEYCWVAHQRKLLDFALADNVLATVGEDEEGVNTLVKLWQLNRIEKESPFCLRIIRSCQLLSPPRCVQGCSVALHSSLKHIAIGFADFSVVYYTGDVLKDKTNKWTTVVSGEGSASKTKLTGLALALLPSQKACVLFAVGVENVKSYVIRNKLVTNVVTHDAKGCSRELWSFSELTNCLIVASSEMVYFYDAEQSLSSDIDGGKGRCHALGRNTEKVQLIALENHIALLTKRVHASSSASSESDVTWIISIYDVEGQCVAFSCAFPFATRIFLLDTMLMVLTQDGSLTALKEKHISKKLETLFKKNLYDLAVGLAKRSPVGAEYLPEIYQKYGDYLYKSGDIENAVQQYSGTIGYLEPSYVIKKFSDGSHVKEFCTYLENLNSKGYATTRSNTILLTCYIKIDAREKIEQFVEKNIECDLKTAVQILRAENYPKEACRICEKNELYEELFAILFEDLKLYGEALKNIMKLDYTLFEAAAYLEKYGKLLVENCPDQTMDFLVNLVAAHDGETSHVDPAQLTKIFVGNFTLCSRFINAALKVTKKNTKLRNIMLELRLRQWLQRVENSPSDDEELLSLIGDDNLEQAVQLCLMFDFAPGIIYAYTKLEKFDDLLEYHMRQNNLKEVIGLCKKKKNQKLWVDALVFTSRAKSVDPDALTYLLESIEEANCVHPLLVLEILSHSDVLRVAHVKNYIIRWLQKHDEQASSDEKAILKNEEKIKKIEKQIEDLSYNAQEFRQNKCAACDMALQFPAVCFLCKHSYHRRCWESYNERSDRCPLCAKFQSEQEYKKRDAPNLEDAETYKTFLEEVNTSTDCMSVIASYISKGLFDDFSRTAMSPNGESESRQKGYKKNVDSRVLSSSSKNPFEEEDSLNPFDELDALNPFRSRISNNSFDDAF